MLFLFNRASIISVIVCRAFAQSPWSEDVFNLAPPPALRASQQDRNTFSSFVATTTAMQGTNLPRPTESPNSIQRRLDQVTLPVPTLGTSTGVPFRSIGRDTSAGAILASAAAAAQAGTNLPLPPPLTLGVPPSSLPASAIITSVIPPPATAPAAQAQTPLITSAMPRLPATPTVQQFLTLPDSLLPPYDTGFPQGAQATGIAARQIVPRELAMGWVVAGLLLLG